MGRRRSFRILLVVCCMLFASYTNAQDSTDAPTNAPTDAPTNAPTSSPTLGNPLAGFTSTPPATSSSSGSSDSTPTTFTFPTGLTGSTTAPSSSNSGGTGTTGTGTTGGVSGTATSKPSTEGYGSGSADYGYDQSSSTYMSPNNFGPVLPVASAFPTTGDWPVPPTFQPTQFVSDSPAAPPSNINMYARTEADYFTFKYDGTNFERTGFLTGFNMGVSKPGYDPGEQALTKADYTRLLNYAASLNANTIRLYTLLSPDFYTAFKSFNDARVAAGNKPIFLLHGIDSPEDQLDADPAGVDCFDPDIVQIFQSNIQSLVTAVHGGGTVPWITDQSADYTTDVSEYIIGWAVGTEWYEFNVNATNVNHAGMAPYNGQYVQTTSDASPFEIWLAQMLDLTAVTDMQYGWQHPMAFTNWVTTDPISHPLEPAPPTSTEDWMSVDATHIVMKSNWYAGYFVTFHAYPYYPSFLNYPFTQYSSLIGNYTNGYPEVLTPEDPYATYLERLRAYFVGYPIMITEVGMPTSFGTSQWGFQDRNHGHNNEFEAYTQMSEIVTMIYDRRYSGVMVFSLMDEWFKKNWNDEHIDLNRKTWQNSFSSEQHFGMIAIEPQRPVFIDGDDSDWAYISALYEANPPGPLDDFTLISATSDASYVYVLVVKPNGTVWTDKDDLMISFDSMPNQGSSQWKTIPGAQFEHEADFVLRLSNGYMSLNPHTAADYFLRAWGAWLNPNLITDPDGLSGDTGHFNNMRMLTKTPTLIGKTIQVFQDYFVLWAGDFPRGYTNPTHEEFSNLAMWNMNGSVLEVRIPLMGLGFADPASGLNYQLTGQGKQLVTGTMQNEGINIEVTLLSGLGPAASSATPVQYSLSKWNYTCFCERYKAGTGQIADTFAFLQSDKSTPLNLNQTVFPSDVQYCECTDPNAGTYPLKAYYITAAYVIVVCFYGYAGIVRPLLERLLPGLTSSGSFAPESRGRQQLQLASFLIFGISVGTFFGVYYSPPNRTTSSTGTVFYQNTMVELLFNFCNPTTSYDSPGLFVLYVFLLSWDCMELMLGVLSTRWHSPAPAPEEDNKVDDDTIDETVAEPPATIPADHIAIDFSSHLFNPKTKPVSRAAAKSRFFFVIACHNSSAKIRPTVEHLLYHVPPRQIVIADNGSSKREVRASRKLCEIITMEYRDAHPEYRGSGINYGHIRSGNKTLAQLSASYNLLGRADYITLLDDDTLLPQQWSLSQILDMFDRDSGTQCVAYPLRAANRSTSLCQMEDLEYLVAGFMKIVQAHFGTALFASGAFNTWRATTIVDILFRHDTMHNGDDLQQGLLLHSLAGQSYYLNPDIKHEGNYKVDVSDFLISTDVPIHWIHGKDVYPFWFPRRFAPTGCSCGEPSLFYQRAKGWDVSRHRFLWKYAKTIFTFKEWSYRGLFARVVALHDFCVTLNDWAQLFYTAIILVILPERILIFHGLVGAWAIQMVVYSLFNLIVLAPKGIDICSEVIVLYPIIYKLPCIVFLRCFAMFYNLLYYSPFVRNQKTVRNRLRRNDKAPMDNVFSMASTWQMDDLLEKKKAHAASASFDDTETEPSGVASLASTMPFEAVAPHIPKQKFDDGAGVN